MNDFANSPVLLLAILAWALVTTVRTFTEHRTRRRLMEARLDDREIRAFLARPERADLFASLKWGLLLVGVGMGLVTAQFLPYGGEDPITYGLMFLYGGLALLLYHVIAAVIARRDRERDAREAPVRRVERDVTAA
jgi:peptidoglycan/LPS O-acetylase OafA/YrhL